jgi:hypothetical protein
VLQRAAAAAAATEALVADRRGHRLLSSVIRLLRIPPWAVATSQTCGNTKISIQEAVAAALAVAVAMAVLIASCPAPLYNCASCVLLCL